MGAGVTIKEPGNDSGGAGGVGTAGDYLRFATMLANGGVLDGQRVPSRTTVRLMTSDHLGSRVSLAATPGGAVLGASTYTFGLGFAVRPSDGIAPVPGSAGDFSWGGYAGTTFWVDPKEQLVAVFMVQSGGARRVYHRSLFRQLAYQAIAGLSCLRLQRGGRVRGWVRVCWGRGRKARRSERAGRSCDAQPLRPDHEISRVRPRGALDRRGREVGGAKAK